MIVFHILALALSLSRLVIAGSGNTWVGWGGSHLNNHWAEDNREISSKNVASLALHCKIPDSAGQSAVPAIRGSLAYYPTHNGSFIALNYETCQIQWNLNVTQVIAEFAPITTLQLSVGVPMSRTSPQIDTKNNVIFFGTQIHALLVAVDLDSGAVLAVKQANPHELAVITSSPTLYNDMIFVGVSSGEENAGYFTGGAYPCCSFIGNAAAFRFTRTTPSEGTFTTVWNVTTIPTTLPLVNGTARWSGAGIWGGQPSIDVARNQVFFATGNSYTAPDEYLHCMDPSANEHCFPSYIWQESVFALDLRTGRANWVRRLDGLDAWTLVCGTSDGSIPRNETLCPHEPGPDADFGMAPTFVRGNGRHTPQGRDIVTVGQKSGVLYGLAADTGAVLWSVLTSPGSTLAGLSWGVAADDRRVYYTGINSAEDEWVLQPENTTTVKNSVIGAASAKDGALLWQVPVPKGEMSLVVPAVVGDLLLTGATGPFGYNSPGPGTVMAVKQETGEVVWSYGLENGFQGGIAVQGKYVFLGTGYKGAAGGAFWVFKGK
jgi:outer membrane protein assembly factor BamB